MDSSSYPPPVNGNDEQRNDEDGRTSSPTAAKNGRVLEAQRERKRKRTTQAIVQTFGNSIRACLRTTTSANATTVVEKWSVQHHLEHQT